MHIKVTETTQTIIRIPRQVFQTKNTIKTQKLSEPQINHSKEKYNQNVNFLGYQQNPTDWPTPMEEKLLRKLREFLQVGSNGWDPARW